MSKLFKKGL